MQRRRCVSAAPAASPRTPAFGQLHTAGLRAAGQVPTLWHAQPCRLCLGPPPVPAAQDLTPCCPPPPLSQVLEFSADEEGRLVARMLRQSMYGVETARRVYPDPAPTTVPEPPRPSSPSPMDTGAPSFA